MFLLASRSYSLKSKQEYLGKQLKLMNALDDKDKADKVEYIRLLVKWLDDMKAYLDFTSNLVSENASPEGLKEKWEDSEKMYTNLEKLYQSCVGLQRI